MDTCNDTASHDFLRDGNDYCRPTVTGVQLRWHFLGYYLAWLLTTTVLAPSGRGWGQVYVDSNLHMEQKDVESFHRQWSGCLVCGERLTGDRQRLTIQRCTQTVPIVI